MSKDKLIALGAALFIAICFGLGLEYYSNHLNNSSYSGDSYSSSSYSDMPNSNSVQKDKKRYYKVLVAKHNMDAGDLLLAKNVKWVKWPQENTSRYFIMKKKNGNYVNPSMSLEAIVGLVANTNIVEGTPISVNMFIKNSNFGKRSIKIRKGMRAMSVPLDKTSVKHNAFKPGDIVEVYLPNKTHKISNVRILAFDNKTESSKYAASLSKNIHEIERHPETVTLELTEQQSDIMVQNLKGGGVYLVLMSEDDTDDEKLPSATEVFSHNRTNKNIAENRMKVNEIKKDMYQEEHDKKNLDDEDGKVLIIRRDKAGFVNPHNNKDSSIGVDL